MATSARLSYAPPDRIQPAVPQPPFPSRLVSPLAPLLRGSSSSYSSLLSLLRATCHHMRARGGGASTSMQMLPVD
eukprot:2839964-Pyramimonas_sp.AAC.1